MSLMRLVTERVNEWGELSAIEACAAFHQYTPKQVRVALRNATERGWIHKIAMRKTPGTVRGFHGVYGPGSKPVPAPRASPFPLNQETNPPVSVWEYGQGKAYSTPMWSER